MRRADSGAGDLGLRQALAATWESLPIATRNELIHYRWPQIGGPELLPVLRRIMDSAPNPNRSGNQIERGPALRHLYELAPAEGREFILRQILDNQGDIGIEVLGILPERE